MKSNIFLVSLVLLSSLSARALPCKIYYEGFYSVFGDGRVEINDPASYARLKADGVDLVDQKQDADFIIRSQDKYFHCAAPKNSWKRFLIITDTKKNQQMESKLWKWSKCHHPETHAHMPYYVNFDKVELVKNLVLDIGCGLDNHENGDDKE